MNDHDPQQHDQPQQNKETAEDTYIPQSVPTVHHDANSKAKFWSGFFLGIGFAFIVGFGGCMLLLSGF